MTSAPMTRIVDALTGEIASPVLGILATADHITDGLAQTHELIAENASLKAERSELYRQLDSLLAVAAERDDLAERLADLSEAHQITLAALADARRAVTR
jgi:cell shape-determining protein MreC